MTGVAPNTAGEGKHVLALVAGAAIFYVGLGIIAVVTDWGLPWLTSSDGTISTLYMFAWLLGTGLASGLAAEAAGWVAPSFNRIGLIVLMVAPVAILAVAILLTWGNFSGRTLNAVIFSFIGTGIGLSRTFGDMMKAKSTNS